MQPVLVGRTHLTHKSWSRVSGTKPWIKGAALAQREPRSHFTADYIFLTNKYGIENV